MSKLTFKQLHASLQDYLDTRKEYPVLTFENNVTVPLLLRGRGFMFGSGKAKDKKGKDTLAIAVQEFKDGTYVPLVTLFAVDKKKNKGFRTHFSGTSLLPDEQVNTLLSSLGNRLAAAKLTANVKVVEGVNEEGK